MSKLPITNQPMRISAAQENEIMSTPTEADVNKVMQETGMGYLQARRHLTQRRQILADLRRNPSPYPLGKSSHYMGDDERVAGVQ